MSKKKSYYFEDHNSYMNFLHSTKIHIQFNKEHEVQVGMHNANFPLASMLKNKRFLSV